MLRMFGAVLLMAGAGGFGFSLVAHERKLERMIRQLRKVLSEMEWELKFRMTPLPELCRCCSGAAQGELKRLFLMLGDRLALAEDADVEGCMNALVAQSDLPGRIKRILRTLARTLGRFDLEGQLAGLMEVKELCSRELEELENSGRERLRCYQTLALCAGAGMVILFI